MENIIDTVAVYGTLKKDCWNDSVMRMARWEYIWDDYIQIKDLQNVWFPMILLSNNSNKWLKVELYNVLEEGIKWPLDSLEWCYWDDVYNHYNRVRVETMWGKTVWVYEINRTDIQNDLENYYSHNEGETLFYNWKG